MKNEYFVDGETTVVFVRRRNGDKVKVIIDTEDLNKVSSYPGTWSLSGKVEAKYASISMGPRGAQTVIIMHRLIMDLYKKQPIGVEVDHINGNKLDNRKCNLRLATRAQNSQNFKSAHKNNRTSGVRGVSWNKLAKKFKAQLKLNGVIMHFGYHDTIEEADEVIKRARARLMPFSTDALQAN